MRTPKPILERRRSVRVFEELPFQLGNDKYQAEAKTVNLSEHGALCVADRDFPLMSQLAVGLTLPGVGSKKSKTIRIRGVVVRRDKDLVSKQFLLAVYFSHISEEDRTHLIRYIESRLSASKA